MENFFKKVMREFEGSKKIITAVLTDIEGRDISKSLLGEMFLFDSEGIIEFSSDKMEAELQNYLLDEDIRNQLLEADRRINESKLTKLKLDKKNELEFFLEPVLDSPQLIVFGAGHIAEPLVKIASLLDFSITVVDDREEFLNFNNFPTADQLVLKPYTEYFADTKITENDYLVIVTRGHQYDYQVLKNVIRSGAKYIGMIGSSRKIKTVFGQLKEDGISEELLEAVHSPIGLEIGSETPAEIAVAIAAEMISVRRLK